MHPYTDIEVTDTYIIREFNENVDPIEMMWHRDNESRTIEILEDTNWKLQLENCLPTSLKEHIFIPKHQYHRLIKGDGTLKLKIYKYDTLGGASFSPTFRESLERAHVNLLNEIKKNPLKLD